MFDLEMLDPPSLVKFAISGDFVRLRPKARDGILTTLHPFLEDPANAEVALSEVIGVLRQYSMARHANIDAWNGAERKKAAGQLDFLAGSLEVCERKLSRLKELSRLFLTQHIDTTRPVSRAVALVLAADHLRLTADSAEGSARGESGSEFDEGNDQRAELGLSLDDVSDLLSELARRAKAGSKILRRPTKGGRPRKNADLFVTSGLAEIWERYTGRQATVVHRDEDTDSPFLAFARASARTVNPRYNGESFIRQLRRRR